MNAELRLRKILEVDGELNDIQDLDLLLERILESGRKAVCADAGSIYVVEGEELAIRHSQNDTLSKNLPPGQKLIFSYFKIPINEETISGFVASQGVAINVPDMYSIPESTPYKFDKRFDERSGYKTVSSLTFPLKDNSGKILGVLQFINAKGENGEIIPFREEDHAFLRHFASTATVAIQRARMTRDILLRMIKMAEMRDPKETGAHVNRVAAYSAELYEYWALKRSSNKKAIQRSKDLLRIAAMLHDVGKVGISDTILKKPGKVNEAERAIIQTHTIIGAELFPSDNSELDSTAREIALRHHENWDGTGYPGNCTIDESGALTCSTNSSGLSGEEIPLFARIVSLMDVFDALSSTRTYKEMWPEEKVVEMIVSNRGKKFDPDLVEAFQACLPTIRQIQRRYPEDSK